MRVKKIIHEELGKDLENIGFEYVQEERYMWQYRREIEDISQYIVIISDRYEKRYLKVLFYTTAYGRRKPVEFSHFVPEEGAKQWEFWGYENEGELRKIIKEFKRLIFAYGLKFLEEISESTTDAVPTEEMQRYLYQYHQRLYEEYREKFKVINNSPNEIIEILYKKMEEILEQPFENVKEYLCGLTALYGHTICWGNTGDWIWVKKRNCCRLQNILNTVETIEPLMFFISEWDYMRKHDRKKSDRLNMLYKEILFFYYRDHPEEMKDDL